MKKDSAISVLNIIKVFPRNFNNLKFSDDETNVTNEPVLEKNKSNDSLNQNDEETNQNESSFFSVLFLEQKTGRIKKELQ